MAIARHQPCIHGKSKETCTFCRMQAQIDNLEDRMVDLEEQAFGPLVELGEDPSGDELFGQLPASEQLTPEEHDAHIKDLNSPEDNPKLWPTDKEAGMQDA